MTTSTMKNDDRTAEGVASDVSHSGAEMRTSAPPLSIPLSLREGEREILRPAVAIVDRNVARLGAQRDLDGYAQAAEQLAASWQSLVSLMALGDAPELRSCPHCGYRIMVKATRCVQCWKQSDAA
jgi:hypothetical protein